jgi:S1-C subfamily serine protease
MGRIVAAIAGLLVVALVSAGVSLAVVRYQSRTNPQQIDLRGVTISEDSAIVKAAAKATPAIVSIVNKQPPAVARGSGYLATSDGYVITNTDVVSGATGLTVLIPGDAKPHDARLVDYDCQAGVAVLKIDGVRALPTLAFADPNALVQGQVVVAVSGPFDGSAITPAHVSAIHRMVAGADTVGGVRPVQYSDTIQISAAVDRGTAGGPLLNVGGQVIGIAMQSTASSRGGFGLNVADIIDAVQQIVSTGQVNVASIGATTTDLAPEVAALSGLPQGAQVVTVTKVGPAASAGLQTGDVITQIDDVKLDSAHPLSLLLRARFHGNQRVTVTYLRGSNSQQTELTLTGQHPTCQ